MNDPHDDMPVKHTHEAYVLRRSKREAERIRRSNRQTAVAVVVAIVFAVIILAVT